MALDSFTCAMFTKLNGGELTPMVSAKHLELLAGLTLDGGLERHDRRRCVRLGAKEREPHEAAHVVDQQQEIGVPCRRRWRDRSTEVTVDQVELLLSPVLGSLREQRPFLFRQDTVLADLLDVVDRR